MMRTPERSLEEIFDDIIKTKSEELPSTKSKSETIYNREIASLETPLQEALGKISAELESGKFSLLIGEDASGRIPASIVKKYVDHIYELNSRELPQLKFVAGQVSPDSLKKHPQVAVKWKKQFEQFAGQKALLITDFVYSGSSVAAIESVLKDIGIEIDVLALHASQENYGTEFDSSVHAGEIHEHPPKIYGRYALGGVYKKFNNAHSKPYRNINRRMTNVTEARSDIENVAKILIAKYDSSKTPTV